MPTLPSWPDPRNNLFSIAQFKVVKFSQCILCTWVVSFCRMPWHASALPPDMSHSGRVSWSNIVTWPFSNFFLSSFRFLFYFVHQVIFLLISWEHKKPLQEALSWDPKLYLSHFCSRVALSWTFQCLLSRSILCTWHVSKTWSNFSIVVYQCLCFPSN